MKLGTKTKLQFSSLLLLALCMIGCAHSVRLPGSFNQRPTVGGRLGGGDINVAAERMVGIEVFDDFTSNPPVRAQGGNSNLADVMLPVLPSIGINVGLLSSVDVYFTGAIGLKWMFLGEQNQEGWKATVFAGSLNQEDSSDEGTSKITTKSSGMEYGVSVGKSVSKDSILYVTLGQISANAKSEITQPGQEFNYKDKFEHQLATLGVTVGEKLYFNAEISAVNTVWKFDEGGKDTTTNTSWMIGGGGRW